SSTTGRPCPRRCTARGVPSNEAIDSEGDWSMPYASERLKAEPAPPPTCRILSMEGVAQEAPRPLPKQTMPASTEVLLALCKHYAGSSAPSLKEQSKPRQKKRLSPS